MKIFFVILVIFGILQASLGFTSLSSGLSCDSSANWALKNLKDQGIIIHASPLPSTSDKCVQEWKTFGTCCDVSSWEKLRERDGQSIDESIASSSSSINSSIDLLKQIVSKCSSFLTIMPSEIQPQVKNIIDDSNALLSSPFLTTHTDMFSHCWTNTKNMRRSAMCYICSGRNQKFLKDGKLLADMDACRTTVDTCYKFADNLAELLKKLKNLANSAQAFFNTVPKLNDVVASLQTTADELITLVNQYLTTSSKENAEIQICEMTLNLREKSFPEKVDAKLKEVKTALEAMLMDLLSKGASFCNLVLI